MIMRRLASGTFGLLLLLVSSVAFATAAQWPLSGRVIQAIVPAQAGAGAGNSVARLVLDAMATRLGTRIVLQHYTSTNSFPGMPPVQEGGPEGYTVLFASVDTLVIEPGLSRSSAEPDNLAPIGLVAESPHILIVNNQLPVHSVHELTEYISKYPGMVHFGSSGNGSSLHLAGEAYLSATGTNMVHVPYSAAEPATNNLVSGDIQAMFQVTSGVLNYVRNDKVRALAVMAPERSPALPDVPSIAEAGYPGLTATRWYALLAPAGTPRPMIERLNKELRAALADDNVRKRIMDDGATPRPDSPEEYGKAIAQDQKTWGGIVRKLGLRVD